MKHTRHNYPLTLLYDGECPICRLEMDNLARRDILSRLVLVDITQDGFDPAAHGATLDDMRRLIHAVRPDGTLVSGVEVFRLAYGAVGLGWWFAPTALPILGPLSERAYALFARNRYQVSALLEPLLVRVGAARAARRAAEACNNGECKTPGGRSAS